MRKFNALLVVCLAVMFTACSGYYKDENLPPSDQEMNKARMMHPTGALRHGVFHMQRVQDESSVLVRDRIELKRPDLPPFDVAYVNRDLESILLELANAAGESIILPNGVRGRTVTLVHSGANFQQMLELVLAKAGYHYNYVSGVWHITRYPIRNYLLELGQSSRQGSIISDTEQEAEESGTTNSTDGTPLDTEYTDKLWTQVDNTLKELIEVGASDLPSSGGDSSGNNTNTETNVGTAVEQVVDAEEVAVLEAPDIEGGSTVEEIMGTLTDEGNIRPLQLEAPDGTSHLVAEEDAKPWYRLTESVGMITVRASTEAHRMIEEYLEQVQQAAYRQVMVEVRIIAVIKDHTTDRGTDVDKSFGIGTLSLASLGFEATTPITSADANGGFLRLASNGENNIGLIIQALSSVADVYTISSPNLLARNNQISRVSITRQLGYAETEVETNTNASGNVVIGSRTDSAKFKNSGTVLSVFPYIGKNRVHMRMRLSVASKIGDTEVQTTIGDNETVTNKVPELSNNLIDQDMVLEFGRVYAIGGLIETSTDYGHSYIPGISDLPGMSEIFQRATAKQQDTEFVVLMKVSRS